jgi:two-component system C4-dicarboxylate transport response regulator DctD
MVNRKKPTILLIDDDEGLCLIFLKVFREAGLRALASSDPRKGLKAIRQERPDVVLLDVQMPGMTGIQVLQKIRRDRKDLPVIMVTGFGDVATAREALLHGANEYVTKPFQVRTLLPILQSYISLTV